MCFATRTTFTLIAVRHWFVIVACLCMIGCGPSGRPELGTVHGKVTLDGSPLPNAMLTFEPARGRPSYGRTDSLGEYTLEYIDQRGAIIDRHEVRISTEDVIEDPETGRRQDIDEQIPQRYNVESELMAEVKAGDNELNFDLLSSESDKSG